MRRIALLFGLAACSSGSSDDRLAAPLPGEGFQMGVEMVAEAGTEIHKCVVAPLAAPEGFNAVGRVESEQTPLMHHMSITALALTGVTIPRGTHECPQLYADHPELMENGVYLYGSQVEHQEVQLPPNVAAFVPGGIDIMYEIHYVNATRSPVNVYSRVNAYTIEKTDDTKSIWGYIVRDSEIEVPAGTKRTEWTRCVMNEAVDVLFLASHTHQLGKRATIARTGGEIVYENLDWHRPLLKSYNEAPLHLEPGDGLELRCELDNPGTETVRYGSTAADEMCQFTMVFTPGTRTAACEITESGVN